MKRAADMIAVAAVTLSFWAFVINPAARFIEAAAVSHAAEINR